VNKKKIKANCEQIISNFKLIFNDKNDYKLNISLTLGIKIMKPNPKIPLIKGFLVVTRACSNFFLKHNFDLLEFSFTKLFKYSKTLAS
jgi:hypothetical protein